MSYIVIWGSIIWITDVWVLSLGSFMGALFLTYVTGIAMGAIILDLCNRCMVVTDVQVHGYSAMNAHRIVIATKTHRCAFHMAGVDTFHKAEAY